MTDDKTMTVDEALAVMNAVRADARVSAHNAGVIGKAHATLSAALQARDAEVAAYADETKTLREELQDAEDEITQLERESEGRRVALLEKAEEARNEWRRAEQAEADAANWSAVAGGALESRLETEAAIAAALPGVYYMDPPDGGDVSLAEQLARMAKDAARYRWLRNNSGDHDYPFIAGKPGEPYAGEGWLCGESADVAIDALLTPHVEPVGINAGGDAEGGGA